MQFIRRWFTRRPITPASFPCPHCGGDVPGGRRSCPACGASESDGWGEGAGEGADDWEDESEFDYESFVEREFGRSEGADRGPFRPDPGRPDPKRLVLWIVILAFAATILLPLFF